MKISRGLRNNNPLNIRRNSTKWKGLAECQPDPEFFSFIDACWGYRAAFVTLRNYFLRHSLKSLRGWIHRWAPPVENDTDAYVRAVVVLSGLGGNENMPRPKHYRAFGEVEKLVSLIIREQCKSSNGS